MLYKVFGLLPLLLFVKATSANPTQGSQPKACHGDSCTKSNGNIILQTRSNRAHASVSAFFEEEDDEDDGEPVLKPEKGAATSGKSFAQTGVKRDHSTDYMEEGDDEAPSPQKRPRSLETRGMVMLQSAMKAAADKATVEE
mmetsp:Transcript_86290/g.166082  ORF Transcript_86290/g.166082 Transcript_86290/m.166082 type:complete len:141 (+) Transcript_86290:87-509(+)|eukprot:CAMPEP_0172711936 /NCGR_PEP_ID=MMETSP1074-20121228/60753_1 /TAXON_ID=2916 /ORGANISM="Ceratium fusus, Strain PA161109" /LENGTH=140 /DNA_ID=CAMNT_0013535789 /DNA_START=79 /DNA_END=501 /DNA_ORIENTATION=-